MTTWQLQSAKQRFSEVVRAAETGEPQFITRHGQPVAVVVDIMDYRAAHPEAPPVTFAEFLLSGPYFDDLELPERTLDPDRPLFEDEL
mgnify:FL=1